MASTGSPWPLHYGGWRSYREWADHGFLPKPSAEDTESAGPPEIPSRKLKPAPPVEAAEAPAVRPAPRSVTPVPRTWTVPAEADLIPPGPELPPLSPLRPYVITEGRTRTRNTLEVHTLVSTTGQGHAQAGRLLPECRAICVLCGTPHSVAEVATSLRMPLGVARILIDDMATHRLVLIHAPAEPDQAELLTRVIQGLDRF